MSLNIIDLKLEQTPSPGLPFQVAKQTARQQGLFLRGPVPWLWITNSAKLSGHALAVGLLLWFESGCQKTKTIKLSPTRARKYFDIHRDTAHRALRELEKHGLVEVVRPPGQCATVTLLVPDQSE